MFYESKKRFCVGSLMVFGCFCVGCMCLQWLHGLFGGVYGELEWLCSGFILLLQSFDVICVVFWFFPIGFSFSPRIYDNFVGHGSFSWVFRPLRSQFVLYTRGSLKTAALPFGWQCCTTRKHHITLKNVLKNRLKQKSEAIRTSPSKKHWRDNLKKWPTQASTKHTTSPSTLPHLSPIPKPRGMNQLKKVKRTLPPNRIRQAVSLFSLLDPGSPTAAGGPRTPPLGQRH